MATLSRPAAAKRLLRIERLPPCPKLREDLPIVGELACLGEIDRLANWRGSGRDGADAYQESEA